MLFLPYFSHGEIVRRLVSSGEKYLLKGLRDRRHLYGYSHMNGSCDGSSHRSLFVVSGSMMRNRERSGQDES